MTEPTTRLLQSLMEAVVRVEGKLDQLLLALNEEDDEPQPQRTLEGEDAGRERDKGRSLDDDDVHP